MQRRREYAGCDHVIPRLTTGTSVLLTKSGYFFRNLVTFLFQHCRIHSDGQEEEEVQEEGQAEEGVDQRPLRRAPTPRPIRLFLVTQRDRAHTVCTGIDGSECIEE